MPSNTTSTGLRQEDGQQSKQLNPSSNVTLKLPSLSSYKTLSTPATQISLSPVNPSPQRIRNPGQREILAKYRLRNGKRNRRPPIFGWCVIAAFLAMTASMANLAINNESRLVELERQQAVKKK